MCKMNFWCSITIILIILIVALVLTNSVEVHVTQKQHGKSEQQLNDFRKEAYKATKDIEVLENFAEFSADHGKRGKRQAVDVFDTFDNETEDDEKFEEEQIQPNCNPDICKARNCAGGICRAESSQHSLKSSKALNNFLNNLKLESKNMPREISLDESASSDSKASGMQSKESVGDRSTKEVQGSEQDEVKVINGRQKRLKLKGGTKNDLRFRWSQNGEKRQFHAVNNLKQNSNFVKEPQIVSDFSSCQQCNQNKAKDAADNNCKFHKAIRPVVSYENIKYSKQPQKAEAKQHFLNNLERSDQNKGDQEARDGDDDDEEDDELYSIGKLPLSSFQRKTDIGQYKFKQPAAVKTGPGHESSPLALNDQREVTKNNLSHEADYKLSKDEQNAAENKKYASWKWGLFKRSQPPFNAMNEIKLKTSQRLMKKGFGASLPSYSLAETRRDLFIDNKLRQREKEIFQSHNRKYENFDETDNIESRIEDLAEMPLEPDVVGLPLNDWSKTRRKRISDIRTRYKRELNTLNNQILTKAFKHQKLAKNRLQNKRENKNSTAKAPGTNKDFNTNAYAKKSIDKQHVAKALSFRQNKTIELQAESYYENHTLYNGNKLQPAQALSLLENEIKAVKTGHHFDNEKVVNRVKPTNSKHATIAKSSFIAEHSSLQPYKLLKRTKRFNPCQTIDLKIYQKIHSAKAFKLKKHQRVLNKTSRKLDKVRYKRALSTKAYAKNSAGHQNSIKNGVKMLIMKAKQLRKNIGKFFKKSLKYLTFQNETSKKSSQFNSFPTEKSVSKSNEFLKLEEIRPVTSNDTKQSSVDRNQQEKYKSFNVEATKIYHKTKNPKLRFFKDLRRKFYNSKQYLESFKEDRITETAKTRKRRSADNEEKHPQCISGKASFNASYVKKSSKDSLTQSSFSQANSSDSVLQIENEDTRVKEISSYSNKKLKPGHRRPSKLSDVSKLNEGILFENDWLRGLNVKNKFRDEFNESLSGNGSSDNEALEERTLESGDNSNKKERELNFNLNCEMPRTKALANSRESTAGTNTVRLRHKARNSFRSFKQRLKRAFQGDQRKTDASHHIEKRSYSYISPYGDLYKPYNKPDTSIKTPSNQAINIDNSQKLSAAEVEPAHPEINFENYYKAYDMKDFENVKNYNPQSKQFDSLQFDNIWPESEPPTGNRKQQKRFSTAAANKSTRIRTNHFGVPFKRNDTFQSETTKLPVKVQILKDKYLKDLENFNKNYKFKTNNFDWPKGDTNPKTNFNNNSMDYSEKLGLEMHNEILNCKAFASLEEFIKSLPKNLTQPLLSGNLTTDKIDIDLNTDSTALEITTTMRPLILEPTEDNRSPKTEEECLQNAITTEHVTQPPSDMDFEQTSEYEPQNEESQETSSEPLEEDTSTENFITTTPTDPDEVKLNISINAQVHGNPKDQHYCGNVSVSVTPGLLDDRLRREIYLSPLEKIPKQFLRVTSPETEAGEEDSEDLTNFISGKFSSKAVKDVLNAVQENPHLKALWPSLQPTHKFDTINPQNFYAIRNQENEPQIRNSEKLFAQAMSAISAIVEQQARSRLCVPLRPDLQQFYSMITKARQQQDMARAKRQIAKPLAEQDFRNQLHLMDPNKIAEKTKIVKKLLKQYDELSQLDQQQVALVRDDLLKNLMILRQLQDNEEQQEREWRAKRENDWSNRDQEVLKDLQAQYSVQFLKLLKAAELYREIKND